MAPVGCDMLCTPSLICRTNTHTHTRDKSVSSPQEVRKKKTEMKERINKKHKNEIAYLSPNIIITVSVNNLKTIKSTTHSMLSARNLL